METANSGRHPAQERIHAGQGWGSSRAARHVVGLRRGSWAAISRVGSRIATFRKTNVEPQRELSIDYCPLFGGSLQVAPWFSRLYT